MTKVQRDAFLAALDLEIVAAKKNPVLSRLGGVLILEAVRRAVSAIPTVT